MNLSQCSLRGEIFFKHDLFNKFDVYIVQGLGPFIKTPFLIHKGILFLEIGSLNGTLDGVLLLW